MDPSPRKIDVFRTSTMKKNPFPSRCGDGAEPQTVSTSSSPHPRSRCQLIYPHSVSSPQLNLSCICDDQVCFTNIDRKPNNTHYNLADTPSLNIMAKRFSWLKNENKHMKRKALRIKDLNWTRYLSHLLHTELMIKYNARLQTVLTTHCKYFIFTASFFFLLVQNHIPERVNQ